MCLFIYHYTRSLFICGSFSTCLMVGRCSVIIARSPTYLFVLAAFYRLNWYWAPAAAFDQNTSECGDSTWQNKMGVKLTRA